MTMRDVLDRAHGIIEAGKVAARDDDMSALESAAEDAAEILPQVADIEAATSRRVREEIDRNRRIPGDLEEIRRDAAQARLNLLAVGEAATVRVATTARDVAAAVGLDAVYLDSMDPARNCPGFKLWRVRTSDGRALLMAGDYAGAVETRLTFATEGRVTAEDIEYFGPNPDRDRWDAARAARVSLAG